ncbi:hypothetical protein HZB04_00595 [Candidatus Wolfebacteria bacterium]|nr:hypothetical protein [Candidatus Wolfebacteria bacterium]
MPILVLIIVWGGLMAAYFNAQFQSILNFAEKISLNATGFLASISSFVSSLFF